MPETTVSNETRGPGTLFWTDQVPSVPLLTVRTALEASGLAPTLARDLAKRYCFVRAKNKLKGEGLIEVLTDSEDRLVFQMSERFYGSSITYSERAKLWFDKHSQEVGCDSYDLRQRVQELFAQAGELYPADRMNDLVKRIFAQHQAVVPLRTNGCIYFVPEAFTEVLDKVKAFLKAVGAQIYCSPVGFTQQDIMDKAIASLVDKIKGDLAAIVKDVQDNGLTEAKALTRWEKIVGQVKRASAFAESMRVASSDVLRLVSDAEINLNLVAGSDSIDVIATLAQSGQVTGTLGNIARILAQGHELPALGDVRVQTALAAAALPEIPDVELPVAPIQSAPVVALVPDVPDTTPEEQERLAAVLAEAKQTLTSVKESA